MGISLEFKPDFEDAKTHWLAFWEQELIERPCCLMRAPKEGVGPAAGPRYLAAARSDFGPVIEQVLANAASTWWGGDAIPSYTPSFGPDMVAAWLGAELEFDAREYGTNWVVACVEDWEDSLPITLDPGKTKEVTCEYAYYMR